MPNPQSGRLFMAKMYVPVRWALVGLLFPISDGSGARDRLKPGGDMGRAENGRSEEWDEVARHGGVDRERRASSSRFLSAAISGP